MACRHCEPQMCQPSSSHRTGFDDAACIILPLHLCAQVRAPLGAFPVSYKYALRDSDGVLTMEHGENRTASLPEGAQWTHGCSSQFAGEADLATLPAYVCKPADVHHEQLSSQPHIVGQIQVSMAPRSIRRMRQSACCSQNYVDPLVIERAGRVACLQCPVLDANSRSHRGLRVLSCTGCRGQVTPKARSSPGSTRKRRVELSYL